MKTEEIIEMARQAGWSFMESGMDKQRLEAFAKLVAAKEREKWKEIVEDQRLRLQALNEIIGGEDSTTTGNILSYSRWEMRLEDAVKEEREACADLCSTFYDEMWEEYAEAGNELAEIIRARGEA